MQDAERTEQFSMSVETEVKPDDFADGGVHLAEGFERVRQSFTPRRVSVAEFVSATYGGKGLPDLTLRAEIEGAPDATLVSAILGDRIPPCRPTTDGGIPAAGAVRWPPLWSGLNLHLSYAVKADVLSRLTGQCEMTDGPTLPRGYDPLPKRAKVRIRTNLSGPALW